MTAVEVIPEAAAIMKKRGVREVVRGSVLDLPSDPTFDTLLLLMNGVALAGTLAGLGPLLESLGGLLAPGGQVLLDSTDLLAGRSEESREDSGEFDLPGELQYQVEFRGRRELRSLSSSWIRPPSGGWPGRGLGNGNRLGGGGRRIPGQVNPPTPS